MKDQFTKKGSFFFSTVAKLTRVAEIQEPQGNQQGNVENVVVQPD